MKILSESAMKKKIEQGTLDLFDLLRILNSNNINENEELRDALFTTLSVVEDPQKLATSCYYNKKANAKAYYNDLGAVAEISGPTSTDYDYFMVLTHIGVERSRLKIKDKYVLLDFSTTESNGSYDSTIAILLLYIENYVKSESINFDFFKLKLIEILIRNLCEQYDINYKNDSDKERKILNKLMNIYVEQIQNLESSLESSKEYQNLITKELVEQLQLESNRTYHGQIIIDYIKKKCRNNNVQIINDDIMEKDGNPEELESKPRSRK